MDVTSILQCNLRNLQKMTRKSKPNLTEILITVGAARQQAGQLLGDVAHPLLRVLELACYEINIGKIMRLCDLANHVFYHHLKAQG